jgi:hypothetical protein
MFIFAGASFDVFDAEGKPIAHCRQKAFKLKEDLRLFTDADRTTELLAIRARNIIDFSGMYDVTLPTGEVLGSARRKGLRSVLRDEWTIHGADGSEIARMREDSQLAALLRRFVDYAALLMPEKFSMVRQSDGATLATFRTHFNPFVYRLSIAIHLEDPQLDDLVILAVGCMIAAIEGRQR